MTLKKSTPVLASFFIVEGMEPFFKSLIGAGASYVFLKEFFSFTQRNLLAEKECCQRCLKAHLLKQAEEEHTQVRNVIRAYLCGEEGHHGHYLDGGEMRKV